MSVPPEALGTVYAALISGGVAIVVAILSRMMPVANAAQAAIPVKPTPELARMVDRLEDAVERADEALTGINRSLGSVEGRLSAVERGGREISDLGERMRVVETAVSDMRTIVKDIQTESHTMKHDLKKVLQRNKSVDEAAAKAAAMHLLRDKPPERLGEIARRVIEDDPSASE